MKLGTLIFYLTNLLFLMGAYTTIWICSAYTIQRLLIYYLMNTSFIITWILCMISYWRCNSTDAGSISIEPPAEVRKLTDQYNKECSKCKRWKPPRAHHCKRCKKCIFRMDHHCEWTDNCIGPNNQKYFILFLIYALGVCIQALLICIISVGIWSTTLRKFWQSFYFTWNKLFVFLTVFLSVLFIIFIQGMLSDQYDVLVDNQTIVESRQGSFGRKQSFWFTVEQYFGDDSKYWWLPTKPKINFNYGELLYDQQYVMIDDQPYLEDQFYDENAQFYKHFVQLRV